MRIGRRVGERVRPVHFTIGSGSAGPRLRRLTKAYVLEDEGIPTLMARNGQEALELLHTDGVEPALILLDLMMPVMNGWEFRQQMETDASIPYLPIVIMSAQSRDDTVGSVAWLQKPMRVDDLVTTIQQVAQASARPRARDAIDVVLRNHARS
jgi:CheY-like chemotaxis protein